MDDLYVRFSVSILLSETIAVTAREKGNQCSMFIMGSEYSYTEREGERGRGDEKTKYKRRKCVIV